MKAQTDTKLLISLVIFISVFVMIQAAFNTEYITTIQNNISYTGGVNIITTGGNIPAPPVCGVNNTLQSAARGIFDVIFFGTLNTTVTNETSINYVGCQLDLIIWSSSLMLFNTNIWWLNAIIVIPVLIGIAIIIFRLLKPFGG